MSHTINISAVRENLRKRTIQRAENRRRLWITARDEAQTIIEMIISRYNPHRIWQWGSVLNQDKFNEISDIDIAVEGIVDPETFFALYGDADTLTEFSLDIVQLEKVMPQFADIIRMKGTIVYERKL